MLKNENRLKKEQDFEEIFKKGKGVYDSHIGIKFQKNDFKVNRVGFVVGTKVSKKAVDRNRLKRRMREVVRRHFEEIKPGFDIMLIARKPALDLDYKGIEERVLKVLGKVGLVKK